MELFDEPNIFANQLNTRFSGTRRVSPAQTPSCSLVLKPPLRQRREAFRVEAARAFGPRRIIAVAQEARVRTTKWHLAGQRVDRVLSVPYMLFLVCLYRGGFENLYGYILKLPYLGPSTMLFHSIFPNSDDSGWVCMGRGATRESITRRTLHYSTDADKADVVLAAFRQDSNFNEDLMERFTNHAPRLHRDLSTITSWERASRVRPGFINDVDWEYAGTAGNTIHQLGRSP